MAASMTCAPAAAGRSAAPASARARPSAGRRAAGSSCHGAVAARRVVGSSPRAPALSLGHLAGAGRAPVLVSRRAAGVVAAQALATPAVTNVSDEETTSWDALQKWIKANDGQIRYDISARNIEMAPGVEVRGVVAEEDISDGQAVMAISLQHALCEYRIPKPFPEASWGVTFASYMVAERAKGDESHWKPYLDMMPHEFGGALTFEDDAIAAIQYAPAEAARASFRALSDAGLARCVSAGAIPADTTQATFDWAMAAAHSRTMRIKKLGRVLLPGLDMINHGGAEGKNGSMAMGKQTWEPRDSPGSIFFVLEKKVFAGQQVLWTYGDDRSMDDFFLYYGFVIPDHFADDVQLFGSPKEFVQWYNSKFAGGNLEAPQVVEASWAGEDVWKKGLRSLGLKQDEMEEPYHVLMPLAGEAGEEAEVGAGAVKHLATLKLHEADWKGNASGGQAAADGKAPKQEALPEMVARRSGHVDARLFGALTSLAASVPGGPTPAEAIKARCMELLAAFPTTAGEDSALLAAGGLARGQELAVEYRLGKKRVLEVLIAAGEV